MSFGGLKKNAKKDTIVPEVQKREVIINMNKLYEVPPAGRTYEFYGESKCGKTISAVSMGYMATEYIDELKEAGFKYIPYALENKIISSIDNIYLIDSEGFLKQAGWPLERKIIGELLKAGKLTHIPIGTPSKKETVLQNKITLDQKSVDDVQLAVELYIKAIEDCTKMGSNNLIIVDSASRLKWLLDSLADIVYTVKVSSGAIMDNPKTMPMVKYGPRNAEWLRLMTLLKQTTANVVITYMMTNTSQWVVEMAIKKGWSVNARKKEYIEKGAEYNIDMSIEFAQDEESNKKYALQKTFRGINDEEPVPVYLMKGDKFSFLWVIENMLKEEIGDDIDE